MVIEELGWGESWRFWEQVLDEMLIFPPILMPQKELSWGLGYWQTRHVCVSSPSSCC